MKSRRGWVLGLALTGVVIGVVIGCWPRHGVTPGNYARITKGMTQAEVDAIFGQTGFQTCAICSASYYSEHSKLPSPLSRRTFVSIWYDAEDRVDSASISVGGFEWWERCKEYFGVES